MEGLGRRMPPGSSKLCLLATPENRRFLLLSRNVCSCMYGLVCCAPRFIIAWIRFCVATSRTWCAAVLPPNCQCVLLLCFHFTHIVRCCVATCITVRYFHLLSFICPLAHRYHVTHLVCAVSRSKLAASCVIQVSSLLALLCAADVAT